MRMVRRTFIQSGLGLLATPVIAQNPIDFELVLFIDCSSSIYGSSTKIEEDGSKLNYEVQRDGHIAALSDPEIKRMLIKDRMFVRVVLWAQDTTQEIFAEQIDSEVKHHELISAFSFQLPQSQLAGGTVHLDCLNFLLQNPRKALIRRTADISTDDSLLTHWQAPTAKLRDAVYDNGYGDQVNVISLNHPNLTKHLREHLQTPNGRTIGIDNYQKPIKLEEYTDGLRKKMMMEVAWLTTRSHIWRNI